MKKLLSLFVALIATTALWASNIITYTATEKLPEVIGDWDSGFHTNAFNVAIISHDFSNGTGTITFAGDVTTIGDRAFYVCTSLTSVTIPNSVTTIGWWAFYGCSGLTSVTIPNSVTTIGKSAFEYCSSLTSVTIPNSVTTIGDNAFNRCSGLTSVTIPNSVTMIGYNAFGLVNNIVYNGTATGSPWGAKCVNGYVDGYLVYSDASKTMLCGCSTAATGEITIPNSVITIGEDAFRECTGLTSIIIPNSVTTIEDWAFESCSSLTSPIYNTTIFAYMPQSYKGAYTIPDGIEQIAGFAFYGCYDLTSVTIPNSVTTIGDAAFAECTGLTSITIPNSVTTIGYSAFHGCSGLTSVTIPNSVTTIRGGAFAECTGLTSITIPNSVTTIGDYAFAWCEKLINVSVEWTSTDKLPLLGEDIFSEIAQGYGPSVATLHVPTGTKSIYEVADQWKDFGTIIDDATALPNASMYDALGSTHKVLRNGQILLERNNATYTLMGQKVR